MVSSPERKGAGPIENANGAEAPVKRKRGRPRDPGADRRILQAARLVAADLGIQGASMSAIADRSGVGKPTIYLRWANRADLMVAAVADLRAPVSTEHSGAVRADLQRGLAEDHELYVTGEHARFLRSVLFESVSDAHLADELEGSIFAPRRERLAAILERGIEEGQVRPGIDAGAMADLLSGPLVRAMVVGADGLDADGLRAHIDVVLDGIGEPEGASIGSSG
jgi:AcrR family transcriptional regulator